VESAGLVQHPSATRLRPERVGARYKSSYNPRYSLFIRITSHHEIFGGTYRDRSDDLLNAIIPNLFWASYSWKKYPAFLTAEDHQIFSALEVLS
jgi:hypothetical protein